MYDATLSQLKKYNYARKILKNKKKTQKKCMKKIWRKSMNELHSGKIYWKRMRENILRSEDEAAG
jgi:hypothetical protein